MTTIAQPQPHPQMSSVPQIRRYSPPETGSLQAILVANASKRLYTHPLEWKADHVDNLSCVFHASSAPSASSSGGEGEGGLTQGFAFSQNSSRWDGFLGIAAEVQGCSPDDRDELMRKFVKELATTATGLCLQTEYLLFRYNRRKVARIQFPLIFYCKRAAWAYMDRTWSFNRRYHFHLRRRGRSPSYTAREIEVVENLPLDPLYVAMLIALAQKAREATSPGKAHEPFKGSRDRYMDPSRSHKVSLFVPEHYSTTTMTSNPHSEITSLKQYTATITNEYLQKFDDPHHFHDSFLHVHQKSIPIEAPSTIYLAMKDASCAPPRPLSVTKKRKALNDVYR